ncbi:transferase family-domain-containing protein [Ilyonectria robusta]|uniref:transferase family-domain-containing protein n=1 Tax=Ilyonectria robusta TaxID=1079257 RepID=UPI001E8D0D66|nr:transferase family-domain-containing protein [Ilyonectria robusta]KAH8654840.1 transferase family-domain-containing protein [Ilyonectria robusta]
MSSIGQLPIELRVHPKEWDAGPAYERYPLSLMGHIMPKIYVPVVEVFALPETIEAEATVQNLTAGLEFAISQFPILSGVLEMDATTGRMWVARRRDSTVSLHVKYMLREDDFPSYKELAEKDFPPGSLTGSQLLPEFVTAKQLHSPLGDNNEDGITVAAFQLNFIRGGLIIGLAIHHSVSDGPGCDGFLTTWAENTVAAAKGDPFIPAKQQFGIRGSPLDVESPTSDRMEELKSKLAVVKDAGGPMPLPPADFKMPSLVPQMWHFAKSKTDLLKKKASSEGGSWISTYDAIMAVLWSSVTRAKLEMLHPNLESKATLVHAVDTRKVWEPPLSERFMGVGTSAARCEPLTVKDIIAPGNLPKLATAVRASITAMTPQYLSGLLQWIAGHEDQRWLEINVNSFLGMDFGGSSWQGMKVYETHDFGFGLPSALRWPSPALEGFVLLYPSRAGTRDAKNDEGIEVCVCLEESCQKRLMEDQVLLEYAELRGL